MLICLEALKEKNVNSYVSRSALRRTAQSALHIMLSYHIGMCVFHERQRDMTSVERKTGCLTDFM